MLFYWFDLLNKHHLIYVIMNWHLCKSHRFRSVKHSFSHKLLELSFHFALKAKAGSNLGKNNPNLFSMPAKVAAAKA